MFWRWETAKISRSGVASAASMARSVPGRPAPMGAVIPGNRTTSRSGSTGSVRRSLMYYSRSLIRAIWQNCQAKCTSKGHRVYSNRSAEQLCAGSVPFGTETPANRAHPERNTAYLSAWRAEREAAVLSLSPRCC